MGKVVLPFVLVLLLVGCSTDSDPKDTAVLPTTEPVRTRQPLQQLGQKARSGGATITATKVTTASSVLLLESPDQTPNAPSTEVAAGEGAKFVIIETQVMNDGKAGLDLTCNFPVRARLFDQKEREFSPIEELHLVPGNPECNVNLQPGFAAPMTWVYRLPQDAAPSEWLFLDRTDSNAPVAGFRLSS